VNYWQWDGRRVWGSRWWWAGRGGGGKVPNADSSGVSRHANPPHVLNHLGQGVVRQDVRGATRDPGPGRTGGHPPVVQGLGQVPLPPPMAHRGPQQPQGLPTDLGACNLHGALRVVGHYHRGWGAGDGDGDGDGPSRGVTCPHRCSGTGGRGAAATTATPRRHGGCSHGGDDGRGRRLLPHHGGQRCGGYQDVASRVGVGTLEVQGEAQLGLGSCQGRV
jgi:hypothetical protein